jgi:hypothetical protein
MRRRLERRRPGGRGLPSGLSGSGRSRGPSLYCRLAIQRRNWAMLPRTKPGRSFGWDHEEKVSSLIFLFCQSGMTCWRNRKNADP